ncbi:hypothetical protein C2E23DRAFT_832360 [Lenzites betulinus]|nr:hypothetical protein C2E23DRAFT_832360 [Lenzites betulinus]
MVVCAAIAKKRARRTTIPAPPDWLAPCTCGGPRPSAPVREGPVVRAGASLIPRMPPVDATTVGSMLSCAVDGMPSSAPSPPQYLAISPSTVRCERGRVHPRDLARIDGAAKKDSPGAVSQTWEPVMREHKCETGSGILPVGRLVR